VSLLDELSARGSDLVDEHGEVFITNVIKAGRDKVAVEGDTLGAVGVEAASKALDELEANKAPFIRLGKVGFAYLIAHWENDDKAEARRLYLTKDATFEERREAMHAAGGAVQDAQDEREAAWEEVKRVMASICATGLKILVGAASAML